jgi:Helix-turn-helix domain
MKEDTYNAKEAIEKLKLPTTTFYRKVREGEIPHKGQRPNMRFPKEAIDAMAEIETEEEENNKLAFKLSTIADAWTKQEITRQPYADEDAVPFKTVLAWRKRNDEISMQVNEGNKILGWTTFLPLEEEIIIDLVEDKMREKDIPPQAVKKWEDRGISVYLPIIEVVPSGNEERDKEVGAFLLRKSIKWALTLTVQHDIKNWYGIGTSPQGQAILEALGFKQINSLEGGERKGYKLEDISKPSRLLKTFLKPIEPNKEQAKGNK